MIRIKGMTEHLILLFTAAFSFDTRINVFAYYPHTSPFHIHFYFLSYIMCLVLSCFTNSQCPYTLPVPWHYVLECYMHSFPCYRKSEVSRQLKKAFTCNNKSSSASTMPFSCNVRQCLCLECTITGLVNDIFDRKRMLRIFN